MRFEPLTYLPALGTGYITSYMFSAFCTGCMFSRVLHCFHFSPHFAMVSCLLAFSTGYLFARVLQWLLLCSRFAMVACFLTFRTGCLFARVLHRLHVFSPLALVALFLCFTFCTGRIIFCPLQFALVLRVSLVFLIDFLHYLHLL